MSAVLSVLRAVLGIGEGASVANTVGGFLNHMAAIPALVYLINHSNEQVQLSTSYGFLAIMAAFVYVVLEILRRAHPSNGS